MNYLKKLSLLLLIPATFTACDSDDNPVTELVDGIDEQVTKYVELQEAWNSECGDSRLLNTSVRTTYEFDGDDFSDTKTLFSDTGCSEVIGLISMTGTYEIDGDEDEKDLNLTYNTLKVRVDTEAAVTVLNAVNFCGVDDWQSGQTRDIATVGNDQCYISSLPKTKYGKVLVDDSEDVMYLSDDFVEDPNERPQTVGRGTSYRDND